MLTAESQIDDQIFEPPVSEPPAQQDSTVVSDSWQQTVQTVLGVVLLLGALAMVHYYSPKPVLEETRYDLDLQKQVHDLTTQVEQLKQDQSMPALVLNRYRNSIGYIYGVYQVGRSEERRV